MPEEQVAAWIKMLAEKQRPLCMLILAESAQMAENSFRNQGHRAAGAGHLAPSIAW